MRSLVAFLVCICAALLVMAGYGVFGMTLKREVSPIELAGLVVNISIVWVLQTTIASKLSDQRSEKNLLIDIAKVTLESIRNCRNTYLEAVGARQIGKDRWKRLVVLHRELANSVTDLERALSACKKTQFDDDIVKLTRNCRKYKAIMTGGTPQAPIRDEDTRKEAALHRQLHDLVRVLIFKINKA